MTNQITVVSVSEIEKMAVAITNSKLFGISSKDQAMALMLIAQAEGTHPALAARDYHIISNKPALKADAMLARFQLAGGKVDWKELTDTKVAAVFSHPSGGSALIDWDMKRAITAQLGGNGMWKKYPRQMLRARVISEGIRTVFPGVVIGVYTPEEVQDFDAESKMKDVTPESEKIEEPLYITNEQALEIDFALQEAEIDRTQFLEWAKAFQLETIEETFVDENGEEKTNQKGVKSYDTRLILAKNLKKVQQVIADKKSENKKAGAK